jgi:hypothetical protein
MDTRRRELGGFGRDRKIAAGDQLTASRSRNPFDRSNDRLGHPADRHHHRAALLYQGAEIGAAPIRIAAMRRHLLHVVTGAKSRTGVRDDDGTHILVRSDRGKLARERRQHRLR